MNLFDVEKPRKHILAFIAQGGHVSSQILKGLKFRCPKIIKKMKKYVELGVEIGDCFEIDGVIFLVVKKHFRNKIKKEEFEILLNKNINFLQKYHLKITDEDYPELKEIILNYLPDIEYRERSDWEY